MKPLFPHVLLFSATLLVAASSHAITFAPGEVVRVAKGEMLQFQGKNLLQAPKGQEFTILQHQPVQNLAYVAFFKEDGSMIAVSLPANALEPAPPNPWSDLLRGTEAFREARYDEARRLLMRAAQSEQYRALATQINTRLTGYFAASSQSRQAVGGVVLGMRETAADLAKNGYLCLALPLDDAAEKIAKQLSNGTVIPALASKLDRADVEKKVATSNRCVARARQAMSLKRFVEAKKTIAEGLEAEPERPELKGFEKLTAKAVREGDESAANAERMRQFANGMPHALTALENGLKTCSDHPKLLALKKEMSGALEERTAPPVTQALLTAGRASSPLAALDEGRTLYTTRCAECHDLELLDSRSVSGWERAVAGMAGRAKLNEAQKARIMDYITVAWNSLEAK